MELLVVVLALPGVALMVLFAVRLETQCVPGAPGGRLLSLPEPPPEPRLDGAVRPPTATGAPGALHGLPLAG